MSGAFDKPISPEKVVPAVTQAVGQMVLRQRAHANPGGLNLPQATVLARFEDCGAMTTANLARVEAMTRQSMSAVLESLEQKGLVERTPHPSDGRQTLFSLTPLGHEARRKRTTAKPEWVPGPVAKLDLGEQQTLLSAALLIRSLGGG